MGHGDLLERWVAGGKQYPQKMAELPFYGVFLFKIRYSWECESHAWKGFEKLAVLATSILAFFFFFLILRKEHLWKRCSLEASMFLNNSLEKSSACSRKTRSFKNKFLPRLQQINQAGRAPGA